MIRHWRGILVLIICCVTFLISVYPYLSRELEIRSTVSAIHESTLSLAIYTDIHHDITKTELHPLKETMDCMSELMKRVKIDALWNLGDIINGQKTTKEEAIMQIREVLAEENRITPNAHRIAGNHDNNIQSTIISGFGKEEVLTPTELNAVLENKTTLQTEYHSHLRHTDYFVDFEGIRVVCITAEDTVWTQETAEWLREEALKTESQVLILAHLPTRPEWGYCNDVKNGELIERELRSFVNAGGTIITYIYGHDHGDMISEAKEWKEVAIGCARFQEPRGNGTDGMTFQKRSRWDVTKILFDVVCVNSDKREVQFIRFGAGENRVVSY